jgi:glycosyltransferase involved in cell wall biosynthesis
MPIINSHLHNPQNSQVHGGNSSSGNLLELTIVLLTHNRCQMALEAIESIVNQANSCFQLVVSDNSDDDSLGAAMSKRFPGVIYRKRPPSLSAIEHGNLCISEIEASYFVLFHDDDLMLPNFVQEFWLAQARYPNIAAFGCNALVERQGVICHPSFRCLTSYEGPINSLGLAQRYFSRHQLGIAPLPSYIYQTKFVGNTRIDIRGGKYGDVQWLMEIAKSGSLIWIAKPTMIYRIHNGNDSNTESLRDRLRFLGFLKRNPALCSRYVLQDYRNLLYKKIDRNSVSASRKITIDAYLKKYKLARLLRLDHHRALLKKLGIKLGRFVGNRSNECNQ